MSLLKRLFLFKTNVGNNVLWTVTVNGSGDVWPQKCIDQLQATAQLCHWHIFSQFCWKIQRLLICNGVIEFHFKNFIFKSQRYDYICLRRMPRFFMAVHVFNGQDWPISYIECRPGLEFLGYLVRFVRRKQQCVMNFIERLRLSHLRNWMRWVVLQYMWKGCSVSCS